MSARIGRGHPHRRYKLCKNEVGTDVNLDHQSPIAKQFYNYQVELDAKHDKYERLIKKSRDVTIESKRIIFLLHRVTSEGNKDEILQEAECRLRILYTDIENGIGFELSKPEVYQYRRSFSPGLQEYVEAMSFYNYLKNSTLISMKGIHHPSFISSSDVTKEVENTMQQPKAEYSPMSDLLNPVDFILGIADLTGELMRKCINSVASGNIQEPFELCFLLQNIYDGFLVHDTHSKRELKRKIMTLKSSLLKVENACYAIKIRGTEIPKHMLADFFATDDCEI